MKKKPIGSSDHVRVYVPTANFEIANRFWRKWVWILCHSRSPQRRTSVNFAQSV